MLIFPVSTDSGNRSPKTNPGCGRAAGHQQLPIWVEELHRCFYGGESIRVVAHLDGLDDFLSLGQSAVEGDEGGGGRGVSSSAFEAPHTVARTALGRKEQRIVCGLRHGASAVEGQQRLEGTTEGIARAAILLRNLNLPSSLQFLTSRNGRLRPCASDGQKESGQSSEQIKRLGKMQCHGLFSFNSRKSLRLAARTPNSSSSRVPHCSNVGPSCPALGFRTMERT